MLKLIRDKNFSAITVWLLRYFVVNFVDFGEILVGKRGVWESVVSSTLKGCIF